MNQTYEVKRFNEEHLDLINKANEILVPYKEQGLRLTLRQLFYQFVTRNWILNLQKEYKRLGKIIATARIAGKIDWDMIEDRVRTPVTPSEWESVSSIVRSAMRSFRLPRWEGQQNYVELWCEKDALAGVLEPIANEYHVTLMVNRGYGSISAMRDSALRFNDVEDVEQKILLYLGDHDPSGEDMVRDIRERMNLFDAGDVEVQKIALTIEQVRQYKLPPNPLKRKDGEISDSRAQAYAAEHGDRSWEVDALDPRRLRSLVTSALDDLVDRELMDTVIERENKAKKRLLKAADAIAQEE